MSIEQEMRKEGKLHEYRCDNAHRLSGRLFQREDAAEEVLI